MIVNIKTEMTFGTYDKNNEFVPTKDRVFDCPMQIEDISFYIGDSDGVVIYTTAGVKLLSSMSKNELEQAIVYVMDQVFENQTEDDEVFDYIPARCIFWYNYIKDNNDNKLGNNSAKSGRADGSAI